MNSKIIFLCLLFYLHYQVDKCNTERITYISTERPAVYWYDTKTFNNITLLSKRLTRRDPRHYVELYVHTLVTVYNNFKMDFFFHQFLTNRYQPSFVEMHFSFCDMVRSDIFFGQAMRTALGGRDCPFPPAAYDMKNMSIPYVPTGFPFTKGRIYCNISIIEGGSSKHVGRGSIDMEVKVAKIKTN